jgi:phospholipid-binding lipoprotein MlaA
VSLALALAMMADASTLAAEAFPLTDLPVASVWDEPVQQVVPPAPQSATPPVAASQDTGITGEDDIVVVGRSNSPEDPLVGINAPSFAVSQAIDDAVVGPISDGYMKAVPEPVRNGIRNFLSNLYEPVIALNYLLQAKPGKAAETLGRFAINTTIGVAGLFDIAKRRPFKLPFRLNGFANTLGVYGVKPGPYLFLPIVGATTPRDFVGLFLDRLILPLAVGAPFDKPAYTIPTGLLHTVTRRNAFDDDLKRTRATSDPYVARRELYLRTRQADIDRLRGRPVAPDAPPPQRFR